MSTTTNTLATVITTITAEHTALTNQLTSLDEKYKAERLEIVSQLAPLAKALEALTGAKKEKPAGSDGKTRKPMSAEGRENIRKALEARKARLAGELPAETPAVPSQVTETESEPVDAPAAPAKAAKAKKGVKGEK
jgi:hypothetical protein